MATILVIEDNPANMKLAVMVLGTAGHGAITATDAEAGLTMARDRRPDLILMDVQLPGMDGLTATGILKAARETRGIPVIAMTALAMAGDEERILAAGFDGYVAKPLDYRSLLATITTHLAAAPAGGTAWPPS